MILNNYSAGGVVSTTDKKSVVYKFDSSLVNTTGYMTGTLSSWMSYNSNTSGASTTFTVDMSVGLSLPVITNHEMVSTLNGNTLVHSIVLTYNKDVTITNKTGSLVTKFIDAQNNVQTYFMIYTATVDKNIVKIMIDPSSLLGAGNYTVTIPAYFVYDTYTNFSEETVITAANNTISSIKLPAPTKILQDENDPSVVYVNYGTKVDMATAGAISSYRIDAKYPISADVQTNSASGAVVKLTFASGTIPFTGTYPFYVQNVRGDNGAYQTMDQYFVMKEFKENVRPVLLSATITGTTITLKFSEKIQGVASFTVKNYGTEVSLNSSKPYYILEDTIMISLAQTVIGSTVSVQPSVGCIIKDLAGNPVIMADSMPVTVY